MRLRPFILDKDFDAIKDWIADERINAMWCANHFKFPLEKSDFESVVKKFADNFDESPFVATDNDGNLVGYFGYSLNLETNEGMLGFVMVNPKMRGKGYGKQMLKLALEYAFNISKADSVQLNVFPENIPAKKCYESVGFKERNLTPDAFAFKDECWARCNMAVYKQPGEL